MSEGDPKLSRLYRDASTEAPPAAVDVAILAAARKRPAPARRAVRSSWVRWMAPASALATLVFAVSLAFLMEREQSRTSGSAAVSEAPSPTQDTPPARAAQSAKAGAVDPAPAERAAKKEAPAVAAPSRAPTAAAAAPPPAAVVPKTAPIAPAPVPRSAEFEPSGARAFPAESRDKASESKKMMRDSKSAGDAALGASGAATPAAPAAAGRMVPLRQQTAERSPQAWLDEIGRLKREGRDTEATEQLAEFRKAYPGYAVPESLLSK